MQRVYRHDDEVGRAMVGARFARGKELRCKAPCVLRPGSMLDRAWYDGGGLVGDGDGRSWLRRWLKRGEERRVREREGKGRKKKNLSGMFGFSKPDFIPFLVFQDEVSFFTYFKLCFRFLINTTLNGLPNQ